MRPAVCTLENSISMIRRFCLLALLLAAPFIAAAQTQYILVQSTLTYHMSHPMHDVDGASTAARGKASCGDGKCDFLIAAPVNTASKAATPRPNLYICAAWPFLRRFCLPAIPTPQPP